MAAPTPNVAGSGHGHNGVKPARGRMQRLMHSLSRVASIQARLVLLRAQWALQRVAVKAALGIVGLIFLIVSLVMLHGGAFVGIEGQLGTMCAYFIMGGIDLVVAAGFAAGAYLVYGEADPDSETDSEPDGEEPRP